MSPTNLTFAAFKITIIFIFCFSNIAGLQDETCTTRRSSECNPSPELLWKNSQRNEHDRNVVRNPHERDLSPSTRRISPERRKFGRISQISLETKRNVEFIRRSGPNNRERNVTPNSRERSNVQNIRNRESEVRLIDSQRRTEQEQLSQRRIEVIKRSGPNNRERNITPNSRGNSHVQNNRNWESQERTSDSQRRNIHERQSQRSVDIVRRSSPNNRERNITPNYRERSNSQNVRNMESQERLIVSQQRTVLEQPLQRSNDVNRRSTSINRERNVMPNSRERFNVQNIRNRESEVRLIDSQRRTGQQQLSQKRIEVVRRSDPNNRERNITPNSRDNSHVQNNRNRESQDQTTDSQRRNIHERQSQRSIDVSRRTSPSNRDRNITPNSRERSNSQNVRNRVSQERLIVSQRRTVLEQPLQRSNDVNRRSTSINRERSVMPNSRERFNLQNIRNRESEVRLIDTQRRTEQEQLSQRRIEVIKRSGPNNREKNITPNSRDNSHVQNNRNRESQERTTDSQRKNIHERQSQSNIDIVRRSSPNNREGSVTPNSNERFNSQNVRNRESQERLIVSQRRTVLEQPLQRSNDVNRRSTSINRERNVMPNSRERFNLQNIKNRESEVRLIDSQRRTEQEQLSQRRIEVIKRSGPNNRERNITPNYRDNSHVQNNRNWEYQERTTDSQRRNIHERQSQRSVDIVRRSSPNNRERNITPNSRERSNGQNVKNRESQERLIVSQRRTVLEQPLQRSNDVNRRSSSTNREKNIMLNFKERSNVQNIRNRESQERLTVTQRRIEQKQPSERSMEIVRRSSSKNRKINVTPNIRKRSYVSNIRNRESQERATDMQERISQRNIEVVRRSSPNNRERIVTLNSRGRYSVPNIRSKESQDRLIVSQRITIQKQPSQNTISRDVPHDVTRRTPEGDRVRRIVHSRITLGNNVVDSRKLITTEKIRNEPRSLLANNEHIHQDSRRIISREQVLPAIARKAPKNIRISSNEITDTHRTRRTLDETNIKILSKNSADLLRSVPLENRREVQNRIIAIPTTRTNKRQQTTNGNFRSTNDRRINHETRKQSSMARIINNLDFRREDYNSRRTVNHPGQFVDENNNILKQSNNWTNLLTSAVSGLLIIHTILISNSKKGIGSTGITFFQNLIKTKTA